METLRKTLSNLFYSNQTKLDDDDGTGEEPKTQELLNLMQKTQEAADDDSTDSQLSAASQYLGERSQPVNYEVEFSNFINHNAPQGFSQKLQSMMPYLGVSLAAWPTYWLWRGYHWHARRRTERIGMYIQRTFQHAKVMQVAILGVGLLMANLASAKRGSIEMHEVAYKSAQEADDE